jgi:hypothetical protein
MVGKQLTWYDAPSPATDDQIASVERAIGHQLPDDYGDFAKRFSGGSPNETDFEFPDSEGTFYATVSEFFTLLPDDVRNLVRWMQRTEFFPPGLVPFGRDGGGNYVCFDYRYDSGPSVVFWHNGRRGMSNEISFVATSFSTFVALLRRPDLDE